MINIICTLLILLRLPLSATPASGVRSVSSENKDSITVPFDSANKLIIITATLNRKGPFRFVLDTGASHPVIKAEVARTLGLRGRGGIQVDVGGRAMAQAELVQVAEVRVGKFTLEKQQFFTAPFPTSFPFDGFLGAELFKRLTVSIDFRMSLVTFTRPGAFRYRGAGAIVPIEFHEGLIPQVRAEMNGNQGWFKLDTGYNGSLALFAKFIDQHGLLAQYAPQKRSPGGETLAAAVGDSPVAQIRGFKLGAVTLDDVSTSFFLEKGGSNAAFAGAIGSELLQRFNVIIDYHGKRLILESGGG